MKKRFFSENNWTHILFFSAGHLTNSILQREEGWRKYRIGGEDTAMDDAKTQSLDHGNPWVKNPSQGKVDYITKYMF